MLYTQVNVRDNIRNRDGKRVFFLKKEDRLTSGARDWLRQEGIEIRPAEEAAIQEYRLQNGGFLREKPEHMTHLYGDVLVEKTHPRIVFRGKIDLLEAEIMLCQLTAQESVRSQLEQILESVRKLIRCDVLDEPVSQERLCGLTQQEIRSASHFPQEYYGQPHFMPEYTDGEQILRLNRCRAVAREAELAAVKAFCDEAGNPIRVDILQALNRVSSMLYILMIQLKKGK